MTNKPMFSVELLPCPFCGSSANLEDHRLIWAVRCTKCSACILGNRAPEPHGDGVSSDEIQDAQAAAMSESTDWAAYEKSAVDAWNSRNKPAAQHQGEPVSDNPQCEECKGWGYHENHYEGGGTECGECGGSGNASVAVFMPDVDELAKIIRKVNGSHTLGAGSLAEAILEEVARLNGLKP